MNADSELHYFFLNDKKVANYKPFLAHRPYHHRSGWIWPAGLGLPTTNLNIYCWLCLFLNLQKWNYTICILLLLFSFCIVWNSSLLIWMTSSFCCHVISYCKNITFILLNIELFFLLTVISDAAMNVHTFCLCEQECF